MPIEATKKIWMDGELVDWIEGFEDVASGIVLDHGGRIVKNIGDAVLFVADTPGDAVEIALAMTGRGADEEPEREYHRQLNQGGATWVKKSARQCHACGAKSKSAAHRCRLRSGAQKGFQVEVSVNFR